MNFEQLIAVILQYAGFFGVTALGVAAAAYALFKWFGGKWLENKFAAQLENLKSEQEQSIRMVQSTIDREIHRAKKLYDNEFTSLSEAWRLLRTAYNLSASTIASFHADVSRMNHEELDRLLIAHGMEEWRRDKLRLMDGNNRQEEYSAWSEWQRVIEGDKHWRECERQIDANSIFFPPGFTEKFRSISEMICASNVEFRERIRHYNAPQYQGAYNRFESVNKLRAEGKMKMEELEKAVRDRLWSVAKERE